MKGRFVALFVGLLVWGSNLVPASADTVAEVRKAIEVLNKQRLAALEHKNLEGYLASFTSDFVYMDKSGRVYSLSQVREMVKRSIAQKSLPKTNIAIQQCTLKGSTALMVIIEHSISDGFLPQSKEAPNKVAYTLTTDYTMETNWVKTASGWQEKSARILHYKSTREE